MKTKNVFRREYEALHGKIDQSLHAVLTSGSFILGNQVERFEHEFAQYLGVKYVICVGNGLEALQIGMMAAGVGIGDEVITTPLSAVATTLAITLLGATPVFVDIDDYFSLDATAIAKKITKRTKAILPVHLYGQSADVSKLRLVARNAHLPIFEDACQAHGATYDGKKLGTFGTFGAFSFYPTKNLACYGDGGAIATDDEEFASACRMLRNYGQKDRYVHRYQGINSRMDEMQAAVLHAKLPYLDSWNAKRRVIAKHFDSVLMGVGDIVVPAVRRQAFHIYHQYVIRTKKRDALLKWLQSHSIGALIHYPIPIHKQPCYPEFNGVRLPRVERMCKEILSIPIHPYMEHSEIVHITKTVKKFFI